MAASSQDTEHGRGGIRISRNKRSLLQLKAKAPPGYALLRKLAGGRASLQANRLLVLLLTFLCYTAYHASRRSLSIVKSVLIGQPNGGNITGMQELVGMVWMASSAGLLDGCNSTLKACKDSGWQPFNNKEGKKLLSNLDLAFLGSYALGMFVSGHLADRSNLRHFLTGGMLGSGLFVCLFGLAYFLGIHSLAFFVVVQVGGGLLQSTGWPSVVSVMANWFGKGKRGLVFGIWNSHTSIGNILGSVAGALMLQFGWGWSFLVPGSFIIAIGLLIYFFLVVEPSDVGVDTQSTSDSEDSLGQTCEVLTPPSDASDVSEETQRYLERHLRTADKGDLEDLDRKASHSRRGLWAVGSTLVVVSEGLVESAGSDDCEPLLGLSDSSLVDAQGEQEQAGVSLLTAWAIPGVAAFSFTLFFAKLVAYTFLYWLPYYINATEVGGRKLTPEEAGNLSILFDVGGIVGGVVAGALSDASGASALVSTSFVFLAIPVLHAYRAYGSVSFTANILLMAVAGFFVNGPYALITTSVSADLGSHDSLAGNKKALATVTAIIDGMGSLGAALGPTVTGYISSLPGGFDNVFYMLMGAALLAGLLLTKLVIREVKMVVARGRSKRTQRQHRRGPATWDELSRSLYAEEPSPA